MMKLSGIHARYEVLKSGYFVYKIGDSVISCSNQPCFCPSSTDEFVLLLVYHIYVLDQIFEGEAQLT